MRKDAAQSLGEIGDPRAVQPLIVALKERFVGTVSATALGKIGDPRAVAPLISVLEDKDPEFRVAAAQALGRIRDPRVVDPLIYALQDTHRCANTITVLFVQNAGSLQIISSCVWYTATIPLKRKVNSCLTA